LNFLSSQTSTCTTGDKVCPLRLFLCAHKQTPRCCQQALLSFFFTITPKANRGPTTATVPYFILTLNFRVLHTIHEERKVIFLCSDTSLIEMIGCELEDRNSSPCSIVWCHLPLSYTQWLSDWPSLRSNGLRVFQWEKIGRGVKLVLKLSYMESDVSNTLRWLYSITLDLICSI
jgi:hypothetical protein